jgi:hypothetical protein
MATPPSTVHVVKMPIDLLAAIGKFAYQSDDTRPHLNGVYVDRHELAATDGHRLVRVDMRVSDVFNGSALTVKHQPYIIPLPIVRAIVGAGKEAKAKYVRLVTVDAADPKLRPTIRAEVSHGDNPSFVIEGRACDDKYPPLDQIMSDRTPDGAPPELTFNPRYIEDIAPVLDALWVAPRGGLRITSWGGPRGPMQFEATGVRFIVMPMMDGRDG